MNGMESNKAMNNIALCNVGIGYWYPKGTDRLAKSIDAYPQKYKIDQLFWKDEWPSDVYPKDCAYNVKPAALEHAIQKGYRTIIWADSSVWAEKPLDGFIDRVMDNGYWIGMSGYNAAQTCSDKCLAYFGVSRDEAERIPDSLTGLFGLSLENETSREFIRLWLKAAKDGAFSGSREHDNQSSDSRFQFHRQDQSCATLIASKIGMKLSDFSTECAFNWVPFEQQTFKACGM